MSAINRVAVMGAGTMGGGIAISATAAGLPVTLIDAKPEMIEQARARARKYLSRQVKKERINQAEADAAFARLTTTEHIKDVSGSDLVIEAVFEDLSVKRYVFSQIEKLVAPTTILATNTSALQVADIGAEMAHPERLCGMHYFSPAEVNPIVEVIRGPRTASETVAAVLPFLARCRKEAIECKDCSGFALNRFFCPYTNEAARCLDAGLGTPAQIDEVAREVFGVPIGPFSVMNIVKPRINLVAVQSLAALGPFYAPAPSLLKCGAADDSWDLCEAEAPLSAKAHRDIADRLKGAVFLAVREELAENIATPESIDLGARKAFAFAKGPVEMMSELGSCEVDQLVEMAQQLDMKNSWQVRR